MKRIRSSINNAPLFATLAIGSILAGWTAWRAFTTLHRLFPQSEAARRTPYWYRY